MQADPGGEVSLSASATATSPTSSYANPGCFDRYVVEVKGVNWFNHPNFYTTVSWGDFTMNQSQCPWSEVDYSVYVHRWGFWQLVGGDRWATGYWNGTSCKLSSSLDMDPAGVDAVRVAAKAIYMDATGEHTAKVKVAVVKTALSVL